MDWSPRETFLAPDGLDDFEYDVEADLPMTVMHKFNPEHGEDRSVEMFEGMSDEPGFWEKLKVPPRHLSYSKKSMSGGIALTTVRTCRCSNTNASAGRQIRNRPRSCLPVFVSCMFRC